MARLRGRAKRGMRCRSPIPQRPLEDDHLHRRATPDRNDRTDGVGRADDWRMVRRLRRAGSRPDASTGRRGHPRQPACPQKHRCPRSRRSDGCQDALPPAPRLRGGRLYSPDFNPIENAFSKLKSILRKAAARTVPDLWDVIRDALPRFTTDQCANYFTATGYEPE